MFFNGFQKFQIADVHSYHRRKFARSSGNHSVWGKVASEKLRSAKKHNGNRRSGVSVTRIFVDPAFTKVRKTSMQFWKIWFSLMTFQEKMRLAWEKERVDSIK